MWLTNMFKSIWNGIKYACWWMIGHRYYYYVNKQYINKKEHDIKLSGIEAKIYMTEHYTTNMYSLKNMAKDSVYREILKDKIDINNKELTKLECARETHVSPFTQEELRKSTNLVPDTMGLVIEYLTGIKKKR